MKERLAILLIIFIFVGCQDNNENKIIKEIAKEYKSHNYFSYKVKESIYYDKKVEREYSVFVDNKANTFVLLDYKIYYKADKKAIRIINLRNEELSEFSKESIIYTNFIRNIKTITSDFNLYTPYYTYPKKVKLKDTIINSINYNILSFRGDDFFVVEDKDTTYGCYMTHLYCNQKNKLVDKIEYILEDTNNNISAKRKVYEFIDFSFEDKSSEIKSLFDFNNKAYSIFTKHNEDNVPFSWLSANEKDTIMTSKLLTYPIFDMNGKATTIKEQESWVLLNFWFFGCVTCKDFFEALRLEEEENGYTFFSKNNIKIMAINPLSSDKEKIKKEVQKFKMEHNAYYSKGINEYLFMRHMPMYYLVSPDKKIIYHSSKINDYSYIYKIIKAYN